MSDQKHGENVCKWCGAKWTDKVYHSYMFAYHCGSWHDGAGQWSQGITCRDRCEQVRLQHEQTIEILKAREANTVEALRGHIEVLQKRIAKATEAAQQANRINLLTVRNGRASAQVCSDGCYAWASVLDDIVSILQGNTPENQESST